MTTSKKEMAELIRRMAETEASVEWFRQRNEELQKVLQMISANGPNYEGVGGRTGPGDPVGRAVEEREKQMEEMQINSRIMEERMAHFIRLSTVMGECLNQEERKIILAKHGDRLTWDRVARMARMSNSTCRRLEEVGMEKLCRAWDRLNMKKESAEKAGK